MKKKFAFGLLTALILISVSSATSQSLSYGNHSLSFEIPQNWSVIKDIQKGNDTQIILSDGANAIRVDLVKHSNLNKIIGKYLDYHVSKARLASFKYDVMDMTGDAWRSAYERFPSYANDAICDYYLENIVRPVTELGKGSGISVTPDGAKDAGIATNYGNIDNNETDEWFVVWTKPEYDNDEIIGVHSLFKGNYSSVEIEWRGQPTKYEMPEPLWTILTTINRGDKPLSKPSRSSYLADLV